MKSVIFLGFVFVVAVVANDEWVEKLHEARKHCLPSKPDDDTLNKLRNQQITDWEQVSKYTVCIATQMGFLDSDGKINVENCKKALQAHIQDESKVEQAIKECAVQQESPGKTAFVGVTCMRKHMGENDFFKN